MIAATAYDIPASLASGSRRLGRIAGGLSLLLHVIAALAWAWPRLPSLPEPDPPAISVDLVPSAPTKGTRTAEPAPLPRPQPEPEPKQIPQLDPAPPGDNPMPRPEARGESGTGAVVAPTKKAPVTRNERDQVLSQVLRNWKPPRELMGYDAAEFSVSVTVLADGTLAPPFSVRQPFDPAAAIEGYDGLHPQDPRRRGTEAFYRAIRQAQPLKLPPGLVAKAPFRVMLDFRVKDAW